MGKLRCGWVNATADSSHEATPPNVVTVAMARERLEFMGAMAQQVPITA